MNAKLIFSTVFLILAVLSESGAQAFIGQDSDPYHKLIFCRARFYDTETGTFLSKDPSGIKDGLNVYSYAHANPASLIDRTGEAVETPWDFFNVGVGAASLGANLAMGEWGWALLDAAGLGYDVFATSVPFLPAGASTAIKALRKGAQLGGAIGVGSDVIKVAQTTDALAATLKVAGSPANFGTKLHVEVDTILNVGGQFSDGAISFFKGANKASGKMPDLTWKEIPDLWLDVTTTAKEWTKHEKRYSASFGDGIKILYKAGEGVHNAADTMKYFSTGAGVTFGSLQLGVFAFGEYNSGTFDGVLIDKAAELVEGNLAEIKGATYDPTSNQIIFLGPDSTPGVEGIDMDYFYTAVQAVYGSAVPPFVSLDAPAAAASGWQDLSDGDGVFEYNEWAGFSLRYNPLWSGEDGTVAVRIRCLAGSTAYDFTVNFTAQTLDWLLYPNGQHPMHLVYDSITGTPPPGVGIWNGPFPELNYGETYLDYVNTDSNEFGGQDWTYPFQLYNGGTAPITNVNIAVVPDRQHRRFGGRLENTKLGWVMQEADRIMKCLAIGTDNVTGATYSSATVPVAGFKNLAQINAAGTSVSGNTRVWFLADEMKLKRHVDPATGRATMVFDESVVGVKTESALNFVPQSPGVAAFANHLQTNFDAFAALDFPVVSPEDASGGTIVNVKIFKMLRDAMQAVALARFLRDNEIPLDMWWMNSWEPPVAHSPQSVATIVNDSLGIVLYGGVDHRKVNSYTPSANAASVGTGVATARPDALVNPDEDLKAQSWTASTVEGTFKAVAASVDGGEGTGGEGMVRLAETDLSFASPGALPLEFTRYYQSGYVGNSVLGPGWRVGRYLLEFERPSWFDETNMMKYFGGVPVPKDEKKDTRLRSGSVRLVDLATGGVLDFTSSFEVVYSQDASGNPKLDLAGLTAEELPVFTEGRRKNGTILVQNDDGVRGYTAYLPDGSILLFDPEGRLEISQDRHGYAQWHFYDTLGRLLIIEDSAGQVLDLAYDGTNGLLDSVTLTDSATGPEGERVDYEYDGSGRLAAAIHQRSGVALARYSYNADNQLVDVTRMDETKPVTTLADLKGRSDEREDARENRFDFAFFQEGETTRTEVQDELSLLGPSESEADSEGRTTSVADPLGNRFDFGYDGEALLPTSVSLPTPDRPEIEITRDAEGKALTVHDPAVPGAVPVEIEYNAADKIELVKDEAGRVLEADYNADADLTKLRRFFEGSPVEVGYGYLNGYLRTITDPLNKTWTTNRDAFGRVTSVVDPTGVTVGFEYDSLGRLWRITDPRLSGPVTFTFDDLDRVVTVTTPAGVTTYTYDPVKKWLKSVTDVRNRTVVFAHDQATGDVLKSSIEVPDGQGGTRTLETNFDYTRFGALESVAAPGAQPVSFVLDDLGRLTGSNETDAGLFDAPRGFVSNNAVSGVWTKNKSHIFTWGAPESSTPVDGYSFSQNTPAPEVVTTTAPTAAWNNVAEGSQTAHVRARNTAGYWGPEAVFDLRVDSVAPTISGVAATPNPVPVGPGLVTISATVQDATSGLASGHPRVRWCISSDTGRPWSAWAAMVAESVNGWRYEVPHTGAQAANAKLYFEIEASDLALNTAAASGSVIMTYSGGGAGVPIGSAWTIIVLILCVLGLAARALARSPGRRVAT